MADELTTWATARGPGFFLKPDAAMLTALAPLSAWVNGQGYEPAAVNTFLQVADYYLVAHALAHKHVVVTHEVPSAVDEEDQDPERVHRRRREVHDALRDAPARARSFRTRRSA